MRTIGKYTIIFFISLGISLFSFLIESHYLNDFFADNAPLLAVAIFTIFSSMIPILLSHIKSITDKYNTPFPETLNCIKYSILELILLMFIIFIMSILINSNIINSIQQSYHIYFSKCIKVLLSTIQICATIGMIEVIRDLLSTLIMCMKID